jgi:hypothetical protein
MQGQYLDNNLLVYIVLLILPGLEIYSMLFCKFLHAVELSPLFGGIVLGHPDPADLALVLLFGIPVEYVRNDVRGPTHSHLKSGIAVQCCDLFLKIPHSVRYELDAMGPCPPYFGHVAARLRVRTFVCWGREEAGYFDLVGRENVYG